VTVIEFPVDGDPYCTLTQYWAFIEVFLLRNMQALTMHVFCCHIKFFRQYLCRRLYGIVEFNVPLNTLEIITEMILQVR